MFEADFSEATVVILYLWESTNTRLKPILMEQLKPGTRIVTNTYKIPGWTPIKQKGKLYLYTLPANGKADPSAGFTYLTKVVAAVLKPRHASLGKTF